MEVTCEKRHRSKILLDCAAHAACAKDAIYGVSGPQAKGCDELLSLTQSMRTAPSIMQ
jgi:hypothetical protein